MEDKIIENDEESKSIQCGHFKAIKSPLDLKAEQRAVEFSRVEKILKRKRVPLHKMSYATISERLIDYFIYCRDANMPYTISGIAIALDVDRGDLYDYMRGISYEYNKPMRGVEEEKKNNLYEYECKIDMIKKSVNLVEEYANKKLFSNYTIGAIFILKNMGWKDNHSIDNKITIKHDFGNLLAQIEDDFSDNKYKNKSLANSNEIIDTVIVNNNGTN